MTDVSNHSTTANEDIPTSPTLSSESRPIFHRVDSKNMKMKKDAWENVDFNREYQHDPKYKTELCKSWTETNACPYGNKCRFAHGRNDLFDRIISCKRYKQKECVSFFQNNFCCYGSRCHFRHEERKLPEIERSYYTYLNSIHNVLGEEILNYNIDMNGEEILAISTRYSCVLPRRLPALTNISIRNKKSVRGFQDFSKRENFMNYSKLPYNACTLGIM